MQTDPSAVLELKLSDRIPIREMDVTLTAKTPNVELSAIENFDKIFPTVNFADDVIATLHKQGLYEHVLQALSETHTDAQSYAVQGFVKITTRSEVNAVLMNDIFDTLSDVTDDAQPLDLMREQAKDENLQIVKKWLTESFSDDLTYASLELNCFPLVFDIFS